MRRIIMKARPAHAVIVVVLATTMLPGVGDVAQGQRSR
jgi:hypothetical protein